MDRQIVDERLNENSKKISIDHCPSVRTTRYGLRTETRQPTRLRPRRCSLERQRNTEIVINQK